ncbi:MAG: pyridoxal phosphate-dependent aminotransferase [bacterium]|nr:pyridoxal phosphate-dependent aminotransferase [bacterium]
MSSLSSSSSPQSSPDSSTSFLSVSRAVAAITPSATVSTDSKAKALRAAGEPVIGFGAGEPDFPTPPQITEAAVRACREPRDHRYSPTPGLPELREAVAAKTLRDSGLDVSPQQVVITAGGKHAVYNALLTLLDPGDEVILPAPYWPTYPEPAAMVGARTVVVPTDVASGYRVTVEQLEAARTPRTKMLIFVSPSNPTGSVYPPGEVEAIGDWAAAHGLWVLTDEIYEHLTYDGHRHVSLPVVAPAAAERCVVINGVAKTYAMTGWRVGWMIAPAPVAAAASALQSHQISNVCNVSQRAALAAVSGPLDAVAEMRTHFDRRRRTMHGMLSQIPGINCPLPQGAFYAFPSLEQVMERPIAGRKVESSLELADLLLSEAKVAVVAGEAFGAPGCVRLSFALADADLAEGVGRIVDFLS